jgi:hypothetical protein
MRYRLELKVGWETIAHGTIEMERMPNLEAGSLEVFKGKLDRAMLGIEMAVNAAPLECRLHVLGRSREDLAVA